MMRRKNAQAGSTHAIVAPGATRLALAFAAIAILAPMQGCVWWLSIESNSNHIVELLLGEGWHIENGVLVRNRNKPPIGNAPGGGAPPIPVPGGGVIPGGAAQPPNAAPEPPAGLLPDAALANARAVFPITLTIAGRPWRVIQARAEQFSTPAGQTIALEFIIENSGLTAPARLVFPSNQWPLLAAAMPAPSPPAPATTPTAAAPTTATPPTSPSSPGALIWQWRDPAAPATSAAPAPASIPGLNLPSLTPPSLPLGWAPDRSGVEIAGQRFDFSVMRVALAPAPPPASSGLHAPGAAPSAAVAPAALLPLEGTIDATAQRTARSASTSNSAATKQWVRLRFDPAALAPRAKP